MKLDPFTPHIHSPNRYKASDGNLKTWGNCAWYDENELEEITCSIKINEYLKELDEPIKQTIKLYTVPYEERWGRW